jgi:hypothetical protein
MRFVRLGEVGPAVTDGATASLDWLAATLEKWGDRRYARAESRRALRLFEATRRDCPDLAGPDLYAEVITRAAGDAGLARRYVRRAEESFASWPAGREVRFRDVVSYVVYDARVVAAQRPSTQADIYSVVAEVIPPSL